MSEVKWFDIDCPHCNQALCLDKCELRDTCKYNGKVVIEMRANTERRVYEHMGRSQSGH